MKSLLNIFQAVFRICFVFILVAIFVGMGRKPPSSPTPAPPTPPPWQQCLGEFRDQDGGGRTLTVEHVSPDQLHVKITLSQRSGPSIDLTGSPIVLDSRWFQLQGKNLATNNAETIIVEITSPATISVS